MIRLRELAFILLFSLIVFPTSMAFVEEPALITPTEYFVIVGDDPSYAQPQSDRHLWQRYSFNGLPLTQDIFWVQYDFDIPYQPSQAMGVLVSLLGSYEVYWDGQLIGKNGVVGEDRSSEVPGLIDKVFLLPLDSVSQGTHTLSLRVSSQHRLESQLTGSFWSFLSDYDSLVQVAYKQASRPMIMSGALLLVALYTLFLYITVLRQPSYLAFSLLCLTILCLIIAESWRGLWGYTYDWQIPRLWIVLGLSTLIGVLLVWFFAWFFHQSRRSRYAWLGGAVLLQAAILIFMSGYDNRSISVFLIGAVTACGICIQAWIRKQPYAWVMLTGLLLFLAPIFVTTYSYMDQYFFLSFAALVGLMLYTLAKTMGDKQKALTQSQIMASRLELELVKRQLQPHFILNTLTAIEEWIEESPATAVKFIQALADEFRYMADMSSRELISLQDEINLCQSHLKVMSYRTNSEFSLQADVEQLNLAIPPGVLLTFLENAISHNYYHRGNIVFALSQRTKDTELQALSLTVPVSSKNKTERGETGISLGIGNQYIEARMRESYGDNWSMETELADSHWQVNILCPGRAV